MANPIPDIKLNDGNDPTLLDIARRIDRTVAQVVLRWHVQRGDVVFPKSTTPARIRENFQVFDFALDDASMDRITALDKGEAGRWAPTRTPSATSRPERAPRP